MNYKLFKNSLNNKYDIINTVLLNRGIENPQDYLNVNESYIDNYNSLDNIDKAVECFSAHFEGGDDICVLVDTDP